MHCAINRFVFSKLTHKVVNWVATKSDSLNVFVGFFRSHSVSDTVEVQTLAYIFFGSITNSKQIINYVSIM